MQTLENRVAIITGGTGALGRAVTENFLTAGAKVAIPWVVEAEIPILEKQLGNRFPQSATHLKKVDVADEKQFGDFAREVESKWGKVDILINLVGGFWGGSSIAETSMADWQAMLDLNVKPTFVCCKTVVPIMQKNKWGRIVSVTSRTGLLGAGYYAAYAVAKGAIATFTVSLAEEVLGDGVIVNAIAPSTIDTEANRKSMPNAKHENWVKPEDIARTLNFLCSDDCRVTAGAIVPVYGKA